MTSKNQAVVATAVSVAIALLMSLDILVGGSEDDPRFAVLELALLGAGILLALVVRFRPREMARILTLLALGQLGIAGVTVVWGMGSWPVVLVVNALLALGFGLAAWLYHRVAR